MADAGTDTKFFESAQALFCAMADFLGSSKAKDVLNYEKYPTYQDFKAGKYNGSFKISKLIKDSFAKLRVTGVALEGGRNSIEEILIRDNDWYKSSINIAVKLIEEINKIDKDFAHIQARDWQLMYFRGAQGGNDLMEHIEELFKIANDNEDKLFGDVNKWSPADIYFASKNAEKKIKDSLDTAKLSKFNLTNLNALINGLIDSGHLLGVSLKKSPDNVIIQKMNFQQKENEKLLQKVKFLSVKEDGTDRDIQIYFGEREAKPLIKIRHDPHSGSLGASKAVKTEIEGKSARLGSLTSFGSGNASRGSPGLTDLWARVDPVFAKKLYASFAKGATNYENNIKKMNGQYAELVGKPATTSGAVLKPLIKKAKASPKKIEEVFKLNGQFTIGRKTYKDAKSVVRVKPSLYEVYQNERIYYSKINIVNSFAGMITDYFTEGRKVKDIIESKSASKQDIALQIKKNNVLLEMYKYASALSPKSGKFVIAK